MTVTLKAVYEKGVLRLKQPLALAEGAEVSLTVSSPDIQDPLAAVIGICKSGPTDGAQNHDKYLYEDPRP